MAYDIPATDVDFVFERERNGHRSGSFEEIAFPGGDSGNATRPARGKRDDGISLAQRARSNRSSKTTKIRGWTIDPLHGKTHVDRVVGFVERHRIEQI